MNSFVVVDLIWVELWSAFETCSIVMKWNVQATMSFEVLMTCKISWKKSKWDSLTKLLHIESVFILSWKICLLIVLSLQTFLQCAWHFPYSFHLGIINQTCLKPFQWMFWASHKCPHGVWHVCWHVIRRLVRVTWHVMFPLVLITWEDMGAKYGMVKE
jgi:hypothetical protein